VAVPVVPETGPKDTSAATEELEVELLLEGIFRRYGYDFRGYAGASLRRRLWKRMNLERLPTLTMLLDRVLHDPEVLDRLLKDLSINVTEMFRDPSFFRTLRTKAFPHLRTYPFVRAWVAGCSTGEEVISLAIALREEGLLERTRIYATDINPASLEKARQGIFALESVRGYTANYQRAGGRRAFSDYYTAAYDAARFDASLCADVTFADHSLATDSVFAETHLVSCRNVLIYFNRQLQDRALGLFHESLCHRGFLGLGAKESIDFSGYAERFEVLSRAERVYRKSA
jgi:chemotaxis protein methyltransferase CheR